MGTGTTIPHGNLFLEDSNNDGIINIYSGEDQAFDQDGHALTASQTIEIDPSLKETLGLFDQNGVALNSQLRQQGFTMGFVAGPPPAPATQGLKGLKGTAGPIAVLSVLAVGAWWLFGRESEMGPVTPGVHAMTVEFPQNPKYAPTTPDVDPFAPDQLQDEDDITGPQIETHPDASPYQPATGTSNFVIYNGTWETDGVEDAPEPVDDDAPVEPTPEEEIAAAEEAAWSNPEDGSAESVAAFLRAAVGFLREDNTAEAISAVRRAAQEFDKLGTRPVGKSRIPVPDAGFDTINEIMINFGEAALLLLQYMGDHQAMTSAAEAIRQTNNAFTGAERIERFELKVWSERGELTPVETAYSNWISQLDDYLESIDDEDAPIFVRENFENGRIRAIQYATRIDNMTNTDDDPILQAQIAERNGMAFSKQAHDDDSKELALYHLRLARDIYHEQGHLRNARRVARFMTDDDTSLLTGKELADENMSVAKLLMSSDISEDQNRAIQLAELASEIYGASISRDELTQDLIDYQIGQWQQKLGNFEEAARKFAAVYASSRFRGRTELMESAEKALQQCLAELNDLEKAGVYKQIYGETSMHWEHGVPRDDIESLRIRAYDAIKTKSPEAATLAKQSADELREATKWFGLMIAALQKAEAEGTLSPDASTADQEAESWGRELWGTIESEYVLTHEEALGIVEPADEETLSAMSPDDYDIGTDEVVDFANNLADRLEIVGQEATRQGPQIDPAGSYIGEYD